MQVIKLEISIIILFLDILVQCFSDRTDILLNNIDILDKKIKLNNDEKIKFIEFFQKLKKEDKLYMQLLFINSNKIIQKYILSLYFHLFFIIEIDELKNIFKCLTECINVLDNKIILDSIEMNCIIHKFLNNNKDNINLVTNFGIKNNIVYLELP